MNAVCCTYDSLIATSAEIEENDTDRDKAITTKGLCYQVKSFSFMLSLVLFDRMLSCTKHLSDQLQSSCVDLATAAELITGTKLSLQEYRTNAMWDKVYKYVGDIANLHGINEPTSDVLTRKRKAPRYLNDSVVLESTGSRERTSLNPRESYKIDHYFPILDTFLAELGNHFDSKNLNIMSAIQACHTKSKTFLDLNALQALVDIYELDVSNLRSEVDVAKRTLESKKDLETTSDVFLSLIPHKDAFPTLLKLVRITLTIAVSTATCEHSFSTLKLVKSYLRSTMGEQRLADLGSLSIEKEISKSINIDDVIVEFVGIDKNRRIVLI